MKNLLDLRTDAYETSDIMNDVKQIIDDSRNIVYKTIDIVLLQRNWLIGKRIFEEELKETRKENYGREIIVTLSKELTKIYGKGFDRTNMYRYFRFYTLYPKIVDTVWQQSFLSWTHYRILIKIKVIYIYFIGSIKNIKTFSKRCLENLQVHYPGVIIQYY